MPTFVFRAPSARAYAVFFWVSAGLLLLALGLNGGVREVAQYGAVALSLAAIGWAAFWRPYVRVGDDGVELANIFRTVSVPWPAVDGVETRWGLRVRTPSGRYGAWAAPAGGARRSRDALPEQLFDERASGTAHLVGDSSSVGRVIEIRLDQLAARSGAGAGAGAEERTAPLAPGDAARVRVRADIPAIVAVSGSIALAVLTATALG